MAQESLKMAQDGLTWPQVAQYGPKASQSGLPNPQDGLQDGPKTTQCAPKTTPDRQAKMEGAAVIPEGIVNNQPPYRKTNDMTNQINYKSTSRNGGGGGDPRRDCQSAAPEVEQSV